MTDFISSLRLRPARAGQAMVEFIVGLVAVVVLFAGLIQLARLAMVQTNVMRDAREEAGRDAIVTPNPQFDAEFIRDWQEGPDGVRHTTDDTFNRASAPTFDEVVVETAAENDDAWDILMSVPADRLPSLRNNADPAARFGMVPAEATTNVPLMSAVYSLLYRADSIDVEAKVWMTSTRDLY